MDNWTHIWKSFSTPTLVVEQNAYEESPQIAHDR